MHHYSTETSLSIVRMPEIQRLFQIQMPEYALCEPRLMRGLMSLSAFHLAYKRPAEASLWMPLAFKHQTTVLRSLRMISSGINKDNCLALFCLSATVALTALSSSSWPVAPKGTSGMSDIIQPLILMRGSSDLGRCAEYLQQAFLNGPMGPLLAGHFITSDTSQYLPVEAKIQLEKIRTLIKAKCPSKSHQDELLQTLGWLEKIYSEIGYTNGTANGHMGLVWKWISYVSEEYMSYLKDLDPGALVIFAHFSILSDLFKSYWYLHGWADRALKRIAHVVQDAEFKEELLWAETQLGADLPIFSRKDHEKVPVIVNT
jgi:hypothetical protein